MNPLLFYCPPQDASKNKITEQRFLLPLRIVLRHTSHNYIVITINKCTLSVTYGATSPGVGGSVRLPPGGSCLRSRLREKACSCVLYRLLIRVQYSRRLLPSPTVPPSRYDSVTFEEKRLSIVFLHSQAAALPLGGRLS